VVIDACLWFLAIVGATRLRADLTDTSLMVGATFALAVAAGAGHLLVRAIGGRSAERLPGDSPEETTDLRRTILVTAVWLLIWSLFTDPLTILPSVLVMSAALALPWVVRRAQLRSWRRRNTERRSADRGFEAREEDLSLTESTVGEASPAGGPSLLGRKSVLMGMLTSGLVIANAASPAGIAKLTANAVEGLPTDSAGAGVEPMLLQRAAASKGAVIGVGNMGVVALRFDDWQAAFKANIFSMLTSRGLPAGYAMISRFDQQPGWTDGVTTADVVEWNQNGIEIHSHGTNHRDPSPQGDAGLIDQIVQSKAEITAWGVKCQGWMQPGATQLGAERPYGQSASFGDLTNRAGQLIRQTYPFSEMEVDGVRRNLPHGAFHGLDHVTVSDGMSLADAKSNVDDAVSYKNGVELMCHAGNLGTKGMSLSDFAELLDYVVAKRDAGLVEVLTPSGLMFADRSTQRLDLLFDNTFDAMKTGVSSDETPWKVVWTTGITVQTSGGHSGRQFMRWPSKATNLINQRSEDLIRRNFNGETFIFEGWARSNGLTPTVSRVMIRDYSDGTRLSLDLRREGIPPRWTKVRHAFTIPPLTNRLSVILGRASGAGIDWDDVHVWKV
jgi:hypothetical protein